MKKLILLFAVLLIVGCSLAIVIKSDDNTITGGRPGIGLKSTSASSNEISNLKKEVGRVQESQIKSEKNIIKIDSTADRANRRAKAARDSIKVMDSILSKK